MIQATATRLGAIRLPVAQPIVVANQAHSDIILSQLDDVGFEPTVIVEPEGRNTAPAVALSAHYAVASDLGSTALLVMPADHTIANPEVFAKSIEAALPLAVDGALVTFGIVPTEPNTGYGYIRASGQDGPSAVDKFVEKPDRANAERYLASGDYYWNAGIFLFTAAAFLSELERLAPDIASATAKSMAGAETAGRVVRPDPALFRDVRSESIDYAVMERTDGAWVVPMDAGWSDVGSWSALCDVLPCDTNNNVFAGEVVTHDVRRSAVFGSARTVAMAGVEDLIVVDTADCVLVTTRAASQDVKKLVSKLKEVDDPLAERHRKQTTGWGSVEPLPMSVQPAVYAICIEPGQACSLSVTAGARLIGLVGVIAVSEPISSSLDVTSTVTIDAACVVTLSNTSALQATLLVQGLVVAGNGGMDIA